MTTKRRHITRGRSTVELSEAARYRLVSGAPPNGHVCGALTHSVWRCEADPSITPCCPHPRPLEGSMAFLMADESEQRAIWAAHRDDLMEEAAAYGFEAAGYQWFESGTLPIDAPIDPAITAEWRRRFIAPHGRPQREIEQ
jgi:hypothetical protein